MYVHCTMSMSCTEIQLKQYWLIRLSIRAPRNNEAVAGRGDAGDGCWARIGDHQTTGWQGGVLIQPLFGLNRIDLYMRGFALFLLQASCLCSLLFGSSFLFSFIVHSLILGLLPIKPLKNHYKTVQFISFISGVRHHIL
ncbi:hypothetical protein M405DRAFT_373167 [Rhizopogon salebrosus TDB-379]|nr:hypothetical protein M405DRAFT_373167 [Rhizopogon salebrosus TDB-379]